MPEIVVTPEELRNAAALIRTNSQHIGTQVDTVAQILAQVSNTDMLEGNRATALITRYNNVRGTMESWPGYLCQFADMLEQAATSFQTADQSNGSRVTAGGTVIQLASAQMSGAAGGGSDPNAYTKIDADNDKIAELKQDIASAQDTIKEADRELESARESSSIAVVGATVVGVLSALACTTGIGCLGVVAGALVGDGIAADTYNRALNDHDSEVQKQQKIIDDTNKEIEELEQDIRNRQATGANVTQGSYIEQGSLAAAA